MNDHFEVTFRQQSFTFDVRPKKVAMAVIEHNRLGDFDILQEELSFFSSDVMPSFPSRKSASGDNNVSTRTEQSSGSEVEIRPRLEGPTASFSTSLGFLSEATCEITTDVVARTIVPRIPLVCCKRPGPYPRLSFIPSTLMAFFKKS